MSEKYKLTEADVFEIMALKGQLLNREIAARYGVSARTISEIHNGRTWASVTGFRKHETDLESLSVDEQIMALYEAGLTLRAIAAQKHISKSRVEWIIRREKAKAAAKAVSPDSIAALMGIEKVSRRIADRRTYVSSGHGDDYGYVFVSLPRVSMIDGRAE